MTHVRTASRTAAHLNVTSIYGVPDAIRGKEGAHGDSCN